MYTVIASDLDGTLLNSDTDVSAENLRVIEELEVRGVTFAPCTGRTLSEIPACLSENPHVRYVIYSNGAVVFDRVENRCLRTCMSNATVRRLFDVIAAYDTYVTVRQGGECFVDAAFVSDAWFDHYNVHESHREVVRVYAQRMQNFVEFCHSADEVEVLSVFFCTMEDKQACRRALEATGVLRVVEISEYNLEIMDIKAGKGNALRGLAQWVGADISQTIAIGDSDNDATCLQTAGLGLAVSNACDSLKAVADAIICSNDEHVLPYVMAAYL